MGILNLAVRRTWERSLCAAILGAGGVLAADPWADRVVAYDPGPQGGGPYSNASVSLGSPERFTGEGVFPRAVSMFFPAFGTDEIVRVGAGGELVVAFDEPIVDDPAHPFGADFIVFGNGGFQDADYENGLIDADGSTFGVDPMRVSVSADGATFLPLGVFTEGFVPTQGYLDTGPYSPMPGQVETDFTVPVKPGLAPSDFANRTYAQALALYGNSGGGMAIDIAPSGLSAIQFVKVEPVGDASATIEIDAFATVPEPGNFFAALGAASVFLARRRRTFAL